MNYKFVKGSVALAELAALSGCNISSNDSVAPCTENVCKLTILHTNDVHSHLDPFPANHPKYAGMGGSEARAKLISALKADDPELLLLDAGDMFQGTPYYNYFKGVPELKIMNLLGYDAGTLGNHEFDNGTSGLASVIPTAKFPILNCNYGLEGTELKGLIKPYQIFKRKGLRIGVFGLGINLQGLVDRKLSGNVVYYKAEVAAQEIASARLMTGDHCAAGISEFSGVA